MKDFFQCLCGSRSFTKIGHHNIICTPDKLATLLENEDFDTTPYLLQFDEIYQLFTVGKFRNRVMEPCLRAIKEGRFKRVIGYSVTFKQNEARFLDIDNWIHVKVRDQRPKMKHNVPPNI